MVDLSSLNPEQRMAVQAIRGPVLILAGAGTGKTRVITYRVAHLIANGVDPERILGVTFTNKAAREMEERVAGLLRARLRRDETGRRPRPTISTFHSLCARILRRHIDRLGYKQNFAILDESEQLSVIKKILSRISSGPLKADPGEIRAWLSRIKNGRVSETAQSRAAGEELARHILARYDSALRAINAVDFDDLILLVLRLFRECAEVLGECRARFQYVMVDEYQDTNAAQFELVRALTLEHRNLCVVGDDDQSIYGWRGAEISNLLDLERHYPEVKVIKLEQNYRSTTTILNAANALIRHNARRRAKQLWSAQGAGALITLHTYQNEEEEARSIVEEIEFARRARRIPWREQAILFRTNIQSRPLETELRRASVRYRLIGGQSFFDRREIRDVLAYLKVFANPDDDVSLLRIANVPARGLTDETMQRLLADSQERRCSVYASMANDSARAALGPRARESVLEFLGWIRAAASRLDAPPPLTLRAWAEGFLRETGYLEDLRRSEKDPEAGEARIRNVLEMVATLDDAGAPAESGRGRLIAFLEDLALDQEKLEEREELGDAVTLITMHSCKGLEFPHVHVVGLEDGLLPHTRSKEEGTVDEERRLFYVAITRAMKTLVISWCLERKKFGAKVACHPSPFLRELPEELVEHASAKARQPVTVDEGKSLFAGLRAALDE